MQDRRLACPDSLSSRKDVVDRSLAGPRRPQFLRRRLRPQQFLGMLIVEARAGIGIFGQREERFQGFAALRVELLRHRGSVQCAPPAMPLPKSVLCTNCDRTYPEGWRRCPYCGHDALRTRQDAQSRRFMQKKLQEFEQKTGKARRDEKRPAPPTQRGPRPERGGQPKSRRERDRDRDRQRPRQRGERPQQQSQQQQPQQQQQQQRPPQQQQGQPQPGGERAPRGRRRRRRGGANRAPSTTAPPAANATEVHTEPRPPRPPGEGGGGGKRRRFRRRRRGGDGGGSGNPPAPPQQPGS